MWILVDSARALYSISFIFEIVSTFVFGNHHNHHSHQSLWSLIPQPFSSTSPIFRYLESCARFAARYISRGRKRQSRSWWRAFAINRSKVGSENSEGLKLQNEEIYSTSMDLPPDTISSKSNTYQSWTTQIPLENPIQADATISAIASDYDANDTTICWSCAHPIRTTCTTTAPSPSISHHIDHCAPYCHSCYFRRLCHWPRQPKCVCAAKVRTSSAIKLVCEPCSLQPPEEIGRRRGAREKRELALLAGQATRCANCDLGLPARGPRWWMCNLCRWECVDGCHYER